MPLAIIIINVSCDVSSCCDNGAAKLFIERESIGAFQEFRELNRFDNLKKNYKPKLQENIRLIREFPLNLLIKV